MKVFTGHILRYCENALQELAEDETKSLWAFFVKVNFKAIDLTLGNVFCSLTDPGNNAISVFPLQDFSLCLSLTPNTIKKMPEAVRSKLKFVR